MNVQAVEDQIKPIIENLGYELVEVQIDRANDQQAVTVFIFKVGGVTLDDCERVHMAIDGAMDEIQDMFEDSYLLNVSSPGLDRPIVTFDDYRRNIGEEVEITLNKHADGSDKVIGTLVAHDEQSVTITLSPAKGKKNGAEVKYALSDIAACIPYIRF